jgi:hypothetical protein
MSGWLRRSLLSNLVLKLVSLALAVLLFVVVHSEKQATTQASIDVAYTLPPGQLLSTRPPTTVRVGVVGPISRLQRFRSEELGSLTLDLTNAREGYFKFNDDMLVLPAGLKVAFIRPGGFQLRFEPAHRRMLPVHLELEGRPAEGYRVTARSVRPSRVMVSGPRRVVAGLGLLHTQPLSLEGADHSLREWVAVMAPPGVHKIEPESVEAQVTVAAVQSEAVLKEVRVTVADSEGRSGQPSPATITVRVQGPAHLVSSLRPGSLVARVATGAGQTGRVAAKPTIQGLPPGVKVQRVQPATILVRLGGVGDKTRRGKVLLPELRRLWAERISNTPGIRLVAAPAPGQKVYEVNAAITELSSQKRGNLVETSCSVSVVLGDDRGSILMMTSGGATVQVRSGRVRTGQDPHLHASALENAVASAHSNVVKFLAAR